MRTVSKVALSFLILPAVAFAQGRTVTDQPAPAAPNTGAQSFTPAPEVTPVPDLPPIQNPAQTVAAPAFLYVPPVKQVPALNAGYAPSLNISGGISVTSLGLPSSGHAVLAGGNLSVSTDSGRHFGAKLDLDYGRARNLYGSGHSMDVFSYLIGPVFYPSNGGLLSTHVHALFGGAIITGPVPNGNGGLNIGRVDYPAWDIGAGAEYRLSQAFGFRLSVDYLRTHFYNSSGTIRGQNDIRVINSLVYYLGKSIRFRHRQRRIP